MVWNCAGACGAVAQQREFYWLWPPARFPPPSAGRPWDVFLLKPVQAVCLLNAIRGLLLQVSSDTNGSR
ncbi:hypothetical protein SAMN05445850_4391 [Paraburkholderia tuberum]|uniref:Uncharacterized protein n=1 Tax=Paraburkholderia tuberum TaxID=157910 RepID=A0A1H1J9R5_9BURK|nr:hypothetical protein SAMN05445850_4391 [Paraburkholderia tuberum]